jgi:hypothetical protein
LAIRLEQRLIFTMCGNEFWVVANGLLEAAQRLRPSGCSPTARDLMAQPQQLIWQQPAVWETTNAYGPRQLLQLAQWTR